MMQKSKGKKNHWKRKPLSSIFSLEGWFYRLRGLIQRILYFSIWNRPVSFESSACRQHNQNKVLIYGNTHRQEVTSRTQLFANADYITDTYLLQQYLSEGWWSFGLWTENRENYYSLNLKSSANKLLWTNLRYHKVSIGFYMEISTIEAGKGQQQEPVFTGGRDCHWRNIINSHSQQLQHNNIIMEKNN